MSHSSTTRTALMQRVDAIILEHEGRPASCEVAARALDLSPTEFARLASEAGYQLAANGRWQSLAQFMAAVREIPIVRNRAKTIDATAIYSRRAAAARAASTVVLHADENETPAEPDARRVPISADHIFARRVAQARSYAPDATREHRAR